MALKRVQWQQKTVDGDDIIVPNAIANADETSSGFTQDENGVLKAGDEIVCKKKLIWSGSASATTVSGDLRKEVNIGINIPALINGEKCEICGYTIVGDSGNRYFSTVPTSNNFGLGVTKSESFMYTNTKKTSAIYKSPRLVEISVYGDGAIEFLKPNDVDGFDVMTFVVTRIYKIIDIE